MSKPINKSKVDFRRLSKLIEEWDDKYSIKVGIIGDTAYQTHEHSDLSNADLGAIHEFGAIKKDGTEIPRRSFLADSILTNEGKRAIIKEVVSNNEAVAELMKKPTGDEYDIAYREAVKKVVNPEIVANQIAIAALNRVQEAFTNDGYGKWKPTTGYSRKRRYGDPDNPTLVDTGQLRDSISFEVKKNG